MIFIKIDILQVYFHKGINGRARIIENARLTRRHKVTVCTPTGIASSVLCLHILCEIKIAGVHQVPRGDTIVVTSITPHCRAPPDPFTKKLGECFCLQAASSTAKALVE